VESCQTECDVFNTCDLKEANVWLDRNVSFKTSFTSSIGICT
jgi:hypothetical protein